MLTLHLFDPTDNVMRRRGYAEEYCASSFDAFFNPATCQGQPNTIHTPVTSFKDIENELRRIGGLGGKIDVLWIHSHGYPGIIIIPKTGLISGLACLHVGNVHQLGPVCRQAIAARGRVFFAGCNVGFGAQGEAFVRAAGKHMLGHGGGVILASTSVTFAFAGPLGQRLPFWGSVRAAKVAPGGNVTISTI